MPDKDADVNIVVGYILFLLCPTFPATAWIQCGPKRKENQTEINLGKAFVWAVKFCKLGKSSSIYINGKETILHIEMDINFSYLSAYRVE